MILVSAREPVLVIIKAHVTDCTYALTEAAVLDPESQTGHECSYLMKMQEDSVCVRHNETLRV